MNKNPKQHIMYLHTGGQTVIWSERIIGIFHASVLQERFPQQNFLANVQIICHNLRREEAKSVILTDANELYLSNIHCRTLNQRLRHAKRKFS